MTQNALCLLRAPQAALALTLATTAVHAASGTWLGSAGSAWTNDANWSASPAPATADTATFSGTGNGNTTVDLLGLSHIKSILFDTASVAPYVLGSGGPGAQSLVLTNSALVQITGTAWNDQAVHAAVQLGVDRSAGFTAFRNDSPYRTLSFAGTVAPAASGGTAGTKTLSAVGVGNVTLSGGLNRGGATVLNVTNALTSGTLTLSGASNGVTTLYMTGNANNTVDIGGGGLFLNNVGGVSLYSTQGGTINGTGKIWMSTVNGQEGYNYADCYVGAGKTLVINPEITGLGGFEMWSGAGTFVFNGINTFAAHVVLGVAGGTISVSKIGNRGSTTSNLGKGNVIRFGGNGCRLLYTGAGEVSDRFIHFATNAVIEQAGTGSLVFSSPPTFLTAGAITFTLQGSSAGTGELAGIVSNCTSAAASLVKDGSGTWTLSAANRLAGAATVSGGTLRLAGASGALAFATNYFISANATLLLENTAAANHADRLRNASPVTMTGGALSFSNDGGAANFSETAGALVVSSGACTVSASQAASGQTSSLTFTSLSHAGTATVDFVGAGLGASDRNRIFITSQPNGLIGPWATVNGAELAAYDSALGVIPASSLSLYTDIAARAPSTIVHNPGASVRINSAGVDGPIALGSSTTAIGSLLQNTAFDATVDTAAKTFQADSIALPSGLASVTVGAAPNDGALTPATAGGGLALGNNSGAALTINASVADNGAPATLTVYGTGPVVLAGSNTFSGATLTDGTPLRLANAHALQNSTLAAAAIFDDAVLSHAFWLGGLSGAFDFALEDDAGSPNAVALDVGRSGSSSSHSGALSGAGSITKSGNGTLTLSGANSYSGGTAVQAGALAAASAGALGTGPVVNDGTLNLSAGNATYSGLSTSLSGSGTVNVTLGTGTGSAYINGDCSAFTGTWNIGLNGSGGKLQMNGADSPAAVINVLSNGTLWCNGGSVHTAALKLYGGNNGESLGQLRLDDGATWSGPVALAGDTTDAADGFFGANSGTGVVSGVVTDLNGAHAVTRVGGNTRTYLTNPTNTFGGQVWVKSGTIGAAVLANVGQPSSLGQPADASAGTIKVGNGGNGARLTYIGSGDTSDRVIDMASTTGDNYIEQAGSGLLTLTSGIGFSGAGSKALYLEGTGTGMIAGVISNTATGTLKSLNKISAGTWILAAENSYTGTTVLSTGRLVAANPKALGQSSVIFPGTSTATLELANDGAGEPAYPVLMNAGAVVTLLSGNSGSGVGINHTLGDGQLSTVTINVRRSADITSGSPSITLSSVNLSAGGGGNTVFVPTDADLHIGSAAILANGGNSKGLLLDGTSAGSTVYGNVGNGLNTVWLTKANSSVWTLSGSNSYSGTTLVNGGALVHYGQHTGGGLTSVGTNALYLMAGSHSGAGAITVFGGALEITGTNGSISATSGITLSSNGVLTVTNSADTNRADRVGDAIPLALAGGRVNFAHPADAASYSETAGALSVLTASNTVFASQAAEGQSSALTFASLSRTGGFVDFAGDGLGVDARNRVLFTAAPTLVGGIIGPWATIDGTNLATYGVNGVAAFTGYTDLSAKGPSTIDDDASLNTRINSEGSEGGIVLAGTATNSVNTLSQNTPYAATVTLGGKVLQTSGLLINPDQGELIVGDAAGDGTLTALTPGGDIALVNRGGGDLTVNAALADNTAASSVSKSGPGPVVFNGPVSHSGPTALAEGTLVFNSSSSQVLPGAISGSGSLVKNGSGVLHVLGANTYLGTTTINAGTARANQNTTFGATAGGGVTIADGATLDVGCTPDVGGTRSLNTLDFGAKLFTVQGNGVGGNGAIVNSSTGGQQNAFEKIVLAGDTRFGGVARWDIRGGTFAMNGHTLTKVGPSSFILTTTDTAPGDDNAKIDITSGTFRMEGSTKLNGSSANTLTIRSGAKMENYQLGTAVAWSLVLEANSTNDVAFNSTASTQNRWNGPVSILGPVALGGSSTYYGTIAGDISGSGPITKYGTSTITLSGTTNTYAGATRITEGTLSATALRNVGETSSFGQPANPADGTISIGNGSASGTLLYVGEGDTSDRVIDLAGTTGGATLNNGGSGPLTLTSAFAVSGTGAKNLYLRGKAPIQLAGAVADGVGSAIGLQKHETNDVALTGNNAYTGITYLFGGTLTFAGDSACPGEWRVNGGTLVVTGTNNQSAGGIFLGYGSGSNAIMRVQPGSRITGTGGLRVGNAANSSGALYISGGLIDRTPGTADDNNFGLAVNANGTYGYLNMSGGTVTNKRFNIGGTSSIVGTGVARVTGGLMRFSDYVLVGRFTGGVGVLTVDGGFIDHTAAANNLSIAHNGGRGELNMLSGACDNTGRNVVVRQNNANVATGIVNACGGTLTLNAFQNNSGTAWLNLNGGTVRAATASATFIPSTLTRVTVNGPFGGYAGGAVIDTAGFNASVAAPLQAPAGSGVYAIPLASSGSGYIGEPVVALTGGGGEGATAVANMTDDGSGKGTYKVASVTVTTPGWNYATPPAVSFSGGGGAAVQAVAAAALLQPNASGGLTKTGAGILTLAATNTYTGATVISNGTLRLGLASALPPNAPVTLAGGTYDLGGFTVTNALTVLSGAITNGTLRTDLSPAGTGAIGAQALALRAGAALQGTYYADVAADGSSDLVAVTGSIDLSGLSLQLVNPAALDIHKQYTVMTVSGARTGTFASNNLPNSRWHVVFPADGSVRLLYSDGTVLRIR